MGSKIGSKCNIENYIEDFYRKFTECRDCNSKIGSKIYYENEHKLAKQPQIYYERKKHKVLPKQNDRYIHFTELVWCYVEFKSRLKA